MVLAIPVDSQALSDEADHKMKLRLLLVLADSHNTVRIATDVVLEGVADLRDELEAECAFIALIITNRHENKLREEPPKFRGDRSRLVAVEQEHGDAVHSFLDRV